MHNHNFSIHFDHFKISCICQPQKTFTANWSAWRVGPNLNVFLFLDVSKDNVLIDWPPAQSCWKKSYDKWSWCIVMLLLRDMSAPGWRPEHVRRRAEADNKDAKLPLSWSPETETAAVRASLTPSFSLLSPGASVESESADRRRYGHDQNSWTQFETMQKVQRGQMQSSRKLFLACSC